MSIDKKAEPSKIQRMQEELDLALERAASAIFKERQSMTPEELEARETETHRRSSAEAERYLRDVARALEDPARYVG